MKTDKKIIVIAGLVSIVFLALQLMVPASAYAAANCYPFASKQCVSNISYWNDSCGNIQALNQNCNKTNQICSNGSCVNKPGVNYGSTTTTTTTTGSYIKNYRTNCYNNNVYWYDSNTAVQGMYQNCQDANPCTINSCQDNACTSQLRCDGSTCANNSSDYATYCASIVNNTTVNPTVLGQTTENTQGQNQQKGLVISVVGKKSSGGQWAKSVDAANTQSIEFLLVVKNTSTVATGAIISADLTGAIAYTGNLSIDGTSAAGNMVSGIDVGSLPANTSKAIYFTGTVQSQNAQAVQVIGKVSSPTMTDSDFLTITISSSTATAAASNSPFFEFIKHWYLWIIIIIVLIALFVIIFRRLSTNP